MDVEPKELLVVKNVVSSEDMDSRVIHVSEETAGLKEVVIEFTESAPSFGISTSGLRIGNYRKADDGRWRIRDAYRDLRSDSHSRQLEGRRNAVTRSCFDCGTRSKVSSNRLPTPFPHSPGSSLPHHIGAGQQLFFFPVGCCAFLCLPTTSSHLLLLN